MRAVWTRSRSDLRRHIGAAIMIAVLFGLTGALTLGSAAGALRTGSAYGRFHAALSAPDSIVFSGTGAAEAIAPHVDFSKLARLPQVKAVHVAAYMLGESVGSDGTPLFVGHANVDTNIVGAKTIEGHAMMPWKVLEGRLPDPTRSDEVAVGYTKNLDPQAAVGSTIDLRLAKASMTMEDYAGAAFLPDLEAALLGPPIPVKVVGRVFAAYGNGELNGNVIDVFVTPTFVKRYQSSTLFAEIGMFTLNNGQEDIAAFEETLFAMYPDAGVTSSADESGLVRRSVNVQVTSLWLFALLTSIVGFMIFGQSLSRQSFAVSTENPILSALGMTRRQLLAVAMARAALIGTGAGVVALVGAAAASPWFPTGLAGFVEPAPGMYVAPSVVGGAFLVALAVPLVSIFPALRAARVRGDAQGVALVAGFHRPSMLVEFVARSGLPASAAIGVRLALEPGRGRTSVPVRSAIVGLTLAVAALTGSFGFAASLHHLLKTPKLYGQFMDFGGGYPFGGGFDDAIAAMVADPGLSDVMVGNFREAVDLQGPAGSVTVNVWGMETLKGSIAPTMADGSWPVREGEVVLGGKTMRQLGARIGDTVLVRSGETAVPLEVVGRAVFGEFGFGPGLAEGAGMTYSQFQMFFPRDERTQFLANLAPGAVGADVSARLNPKFGPLGAGVASLEDQKRLGYWQDSAVTGLESAQRIPLALSGLLALAAIGTLVHTLVMSISRRRRDLAVLKTLGFVRGQISATVAWQATTLVCISLLIGLPLGVAVGRWAWTLFANAIGVLPVAIVDLPPLLLAIPVTIVLANVIALVPGRLAAATRPAVVLRSE